MIIFLILVFVFFGTVLFLGRKYSNPFKITMIFGKRGVGKSSDIVKRALRYKKAGKRVFCTDPELCHGVCEFIDVSDLGLVALPWNSVLFVDECGILFHKRGFADKDQQAIMKNFRKFLKMSRHFGVSVTLYSQQYDIDLSLKEACDELWLLEKWFNCLTVGKRINKSIVLTKDADGNGKMADSYTFDPFWVLGSRSFTFIPAYVKYYDSFYKYDLPSYDEVYGDQLPEEDISDLPDLPDLSDLSDISDLPDPPDIPYKPFNPYSS